MAEKGYCGCNNCYCDIGYSPRTRAVRVHTYIRTYHYGGEKVRSGHLTNRDIAGGPSYNDIIEKHTKQLEYGHVFSYPDTL